MIKPSTVLLACLFLTIKAYADDDDQPRTGVSGQPPASEHQDGLLLDPEMQKRAGIQTVKLTPSLNGPETLVFGNVAPLDRLLILRQQYLNSLAEQQAAQAKNTEAQLNLHRTKTLNDQEIVSKRRLQEQMTQARTEQSQLAISQYQKDLVINNCQLEWGATLCQWLTESKGSKMREFIELKAQLLQITLPAGHELRPEQTQVFVDEHGERERAIPATLLSAIPMIDPVTQGRRYIFKSSQRLLPFGSHLSVWLPEASPSRTSVSLPRSAVVRHNGETLVFIKTADNRFIRQPLSKLTPSLDCCFSTQELSIGQEIVSTGAQTLLSQSLKSQIPQEDDDD